MPQSLSGKSELVVMDESFNFLIIFDVRTSRMEVVTSATGVLELPISGNMPIGGPKEILRRIFAMAGLAGSLESAVERLGANIKAPFKSVSQVCGSTQGHVALAREELGDVPLALTERLSELLASDASSVKGPGDLLSHVEDQSLLGYQACVVALLRGISV
jgi:hypothetical protein